jgi:predicted RNA-binding protein
MCESSAWLQTSEEAEELLLDDVMQLRPEGAKIVLTNILGEQRVVDAELVQVDLMRHRIVLRARS